MNAPVALALLPVVVAVAAAQLRRTLGLDDDEHDEETNAEITGLLNHLVMEELAKI
jgi:hypothetical protein